MVSYRTRYRYVLGIKCVTKFIITANIADAIIRATWITICVQQSMVMLIEICAMNVVLKRKEISRDTWKTTDNLVEHYRLKNGKTNNQ